MQRACEISCCDLNQACAIMDEKRFRASGLGFRGDSSLQIAISALDAHAVITYRMSCRFVFAPSSPLGCSLQLSCRGFDAIAPVVVILTRLPNGAAGSRTSNCIIALEKARDSMNSAHAATSS